MDIRDILKQLCSYKGVEIIEGHIMPDHIHSDLMVNIILVLDKIFKVGYKTINPKYEYREVTLWIDRKFREYLAEIRELEDTRYLNKQITDEIYSSSRRSIQGKYKEYFKELLGVSNSEINESKFINIEAVEDADILKYL